MGWPVTCPKCQKKGTLTLKQVKSVHYGYVTIIPGGEVVSLGKPGTGNRRRAEQLGMVVEREVHNPRVGKGESNKMVVKRLKQTYGPWYLPYVRHYDPERYKQAMVAYKAGKLKARPNGVRWCNIRTKLREEETISEFAKLCQRYEIDRYELQKDLKFNKFHMALRRRVKHEKESRSYHPLTQIFTKFEEKRKQLLRKTTNSNPASP